MNHNPHLPIKRHTGLTEDQERQAVVDAAIAWRGTPYMQMGYRRGPGGAVDCSMLLVGAWVDAGIFEPFDPRPYPPEWHMHRSEERYLEWLDMIALRTETPRIGDVVCWLVGHCFAHAGIIVSDTEVVHAYVTHRQCSKTSIDNPELSRLDINFKRPRIFFDMWGRIR